MSMVLHAEVRFGWVGNVNVMRIIKNITYQNFTCLSIPQVEHLLSSCIMYRISYIVKYVYDYDPW